MNEIMRISFGAKLLINLNQYSMILLGWPTKHESKQHPNKDSDNFSGWCKNDLIAKYLSYAVYACAYWNNEKTGPFRLAVSSGFLNHR